jgi:microcystin-dependent protein
MKRIDFTNLGGLPFSQNRADFMQQSYTEAFGALAKLCGEKVIVHGVVSDGVNVTDGWIVYNSELIRFIGGSYAAEVVITETATPYTFADNTLHDVEFTKTATCGPVGAFDFADLVPLLTLQNTWKKDDIRQCMKDAAYEAANFDVDGFGTTAAEKGWRILSKVYTDAAGAVLVNKKTGDTDFGLVGNDGGEKTHTLISGEQGALTAAAMLDDIGGGGATVIARLKMNGVEVIRNGASNQGGWGSDTTIPAAAAADAHNNLQPYFVVLTLIKL